MSIVKQPGAVVHSDAWKFFCREMSDKQYGDEEVRNAWLWFLQGWLSKARQQDNLRGVR